MSERFFSAEPISGELVRLDGAEAHHLLHVMRGAVGDAVTLFDGGGAEFAAVVERLDRSDVFLRVVGRREIDRELPFPLTVGVALPKGDRQKWLVEKLTELGVSALLPVVTERGVAQPAGGALERLRRSVSEAAKQCGRNRLMKIAEPQSWQEWVDDGSQASGSSQQSQPRRLLASPGGRPFGQLDMSVRLPTHIAIGPEGGFSAAEVAFATSAGWQPVDLGARILRVETAAVALTAAVTLASAGVDTPG